MQAETGSRGSLHGGRALAPPAVGTHAARQVFAVLTREVETRVVLEDATLRVCFHCVCGATRTVGDVKAFKAHFVCQRHLEHLAGLG